MRQGPSSSRKVDLCDDSHPGGTLTFCLPQLMSFASSGAFYLRPALTYTMSSACVHTQFISLSSCFICLCVFCVECGDLMRVLLPGRCSCYAHLMISLLHFPSIIPLHTYTKDTTIKTTTSTTKACTCLQPHCSPLPHCTQPSHTHTHTRQNRPNISLIPSHQQPLHPSRSAHSLTNKYTHKHT